jgi:hypothetical protein
MAKGVRLLYVNTLTYRQVAPTHWRMTTAIGGLTTEAWIRWRLNEGGGSGL